MNSDVDWATAAAVQPFPEYPYATFDIHQVIAPTRSIELARDHLTAYLQRVAAVDDDGPTGRSAWRRFGDGNALAVVGASGTGKTTLINDLLRHAIEEPPIPGVNPGNAVYLHGATGGPLDLYRRLVAFLTVDYLRARVDDFYADVVADTLADSEVTSGLADSLRNRDENPGLVVQRLALTESRLHSQVRERMTKATRKSQISAPFSKVLSLLLRPGFHNAVERWVSGAQPDPILRERGIDLVINTDAKAVEAFTAIVALHRPHNRPFVLAIDDLDKSYDVIRSSGQRDVQEQWALLMQRFMTGFASSGGLLVFSAPRDADRRIGVDTLQGTGRTIVMNPFSVRETYDLIHARLAGVLDVRGVWPFLESVPKVVNRLTHGSARETVELCYAAYRRAVRTAQPVTEHRLLRAFRDTLVPRSVAETRRSITSVLTRIRVNVQFNRVLTRDGRRSDVDFWLPIGSSGCAVVILDAVVGAPDIDTVLDRVARLRTVLPDDGRIVLVTARHDDDLVPMAELPDVVQLCHGDTYFAENLATDITEIARQLGGDAEQHTLYRMMNESQRESTEQFHTLYSAIERLRDERETTSREVAPREVERVDDAADDRTRWIRGLLDERFQEPIRKLDALYPVGRNLESAFSPVADQPRPDVLEAIDRSVRPVPSDPVPPAALSLLLTEVLRAFAEGVYVWYRNAEHDGDGNPTQKSLAPLLQLCQTYEEVLDRIDVSERLAPHAVYPDLSESIVNLARNVRDLVSERAVA